jgi:uncharacterized membrane protein YkgB
VADHLNKRYIPERPQLPTHALSRDNLVLRIGVFLGFLPLAALTALFVRVAISGGTYRTLYFVPFTAVLPFVVQMIGAFIASVRGEPVSKSAGRMIITTGFFIAFAIVLMVKGVV